MRIDCNKIVGFTGVIAVVLMLHYWVLPHLEDLTPTALFRFDSFIVALVILVPFVQGDIVIFGRELQENPRDSQPVAQQTPQVSQRGRPTASPHRPTRMWECMRWLCASLAGIAISWGVALLFAFLINYLDVQEIRTQDRQNQPARGGSSEQNLEPSPNHQKDGSHKAPAKEVTPRERDFL